MNRWEAERLAEEAARLARVTLLRDGVLRACEALARELSDEEAFRVITEAAESIDEVCDAAVLTALRKGAARDGARSAAPVPGVKVKR